MSDELIIPSEYAETIDVFLSPTAMPNAFERKVRCMMLSDLCREEAERTVRSTPIQMEIFYDISRGLFAVESEPIRYIDVFNPYTGEVIPQEDDNE